MNLIYPSKITGVVADKENANYPASNVLDAHPKKVWKSTDNTGTLQCAVDADADTIAIHNTNASSIVITTQEIGAIDWQPGSEIDWQEDSELSWQAAASAVTKIYDLTSEGVGRLWGSYEALGARHVVEIAFIAESGTIVEAGVVDIGIGNPFNDPLQGVAQGLKPYGVFKKLNNAADYIRVIEIVRTFKFKFVANIDTEFYAFMSDILQVWGPRPLSWRLCDGALTNWEWVAYAQCDPSNMPQGLHSLPANSDIDVSLIEVI